MLQYILYSSAILCAFYSNLAKRIFIIIRLARSALPSKVFSFLAHPERPSLHSRFITTAGKQAARWAIQYNVLTLSRQRWNTSTLQSHFRCLNSAVAAQLQYSVIRERWKLGWFPVHSNSTLLLVVFNSSSTTTQGLSFDFFLNAMCPI